jgi:hypothetical protein
MAMSSVQSQLSDDFELVAGVDEAGCVVEVEVEVEVEVGVVGGGVDETALKGMPAV